MQHCMAFYLFTEFKTHPYRPKDDAHYSVIQPRANAKVHPARTAGTLCGTASTTPKTMQTTHTLVLWPALAAIFVLLTGLLLRKRLLLLHALLSAILALTAAVATQVYQDYSWASAVLLPLAASSQVIQEHQETLPQRPWTRLYRPVTSIRVVSRSNVTMEANGQRLLELELQDFTLGNGLQPVTRQAMLNCERQDLVSRLDDGLFIETLSAADPLLRLFCQPE